MQTASPGAAISPHLPVRQDWLDRRREEIIEPDLPIVDPHHHLVDRPETGRYLLPELLADIATGHNVTATVYLESLSMYRAEGPASHPDQAEWGSAVIRPASLLLDPRVREGFARLEPLGLSFDAWMYHTQLGELVGLARAFPATPIVLDHVGGPIGLGPYAGRRDEVFAAWSARVRELSACANVHIKLGGLGMRMFGFTHHTGELPPSSEELAAAWRPYIETCIAAFGPERAMFESNFPVDKGSGGYAALWNAFKRIAAGYSAAEKAALFSGTASKFYRL